MKNQHGIKKREGWQIRSGRDRNDKSWIWWRCIAAKYWHLLESLAGTSSESVWTQNSVYLTRCTNPQDCDMAVTQETSVWEKTGGKNLQSFLRKQLCKRLSGCKATRGAERETQEREVSSSPAQSTHGDQHVSAKIKTSPLLCLRTACWNAHWSRETPHFSPAHTWAAAAPPPALRTAQVWVNACSVKPSVYTETRLRLQEASAVKRDHLSLFIAHSQGFLKQVME